MIRLKVFEIIVYSNKENLFWDVYFLAAKNLWAYVQLLKTRFCWGLQDKKNPLLKQKIKTIEIEDLQIQRLLNENTITTTTTKTSTTKREENKDNQNLVVIFIN